MMVGCMNAKESLAVFISNLNPDVCTASVSACHSDSKLNCVSLFPQQAGQRMMMRMMKMAQSLTALQYPIRWNPHLRDVALQMVSTHIHVYSCTCMQKLKYSTILEHKFWVANEYICTFVVGLFLKLHLNSICFIVESPFLYNELLLCNTFDSNLALRLTLNSTCKIAKHTNSRLTKAVIY